jgi:hypothetical protein
MRFAQEDQGLFLCGSDSELLRMSRIEAVHGTHSILGYNLKDYLRVACASAQSESSALTRRSLNRLLAASVIVSLQLRRSAAFTL